MLGESTEKGLLIINAQPDLIAEASQLESEERIAGVVWAMAVYDFNQQKITMASMDYSEAALHIFELCKAHSKTVGLERNWHVLAAFSPLGMSDLDLENFQSPNTQVHVLIKNDKRVEPMALTFHAMGVLLKCV